MHWGYLVIPWVGLSIVLVLNIIKKKNAIISKVNGVIYAIITIIVAILFVVYANGFDTRVKWLDAVTITCILLAIAVAVHVSLEVFDILKTHNVITPVETTPLFIVYVIATGLYTLSLTLAFMFYEAAPQPPPPPDNNPPPPNNNPPPPPNNNPPPPIPPANINPPPPPNNNPPPSIPPASNKNGDNKDKDKEPNKNQPNNGQPVNQPPDEPKPSNMYPNIFTIYYRGIAYSQNVDIELNSYWNSQRDKIRKAFREGDHSNIFNELTIAFRYHVGNLWKNEMPYRDEPIKQELAVSISQVAIPWIKSHGKKPKQPIIFYFFNLEDKNKVQAIQRNPNGTFAASALDAKNIAWVACPHIGGAAGTGAKNLGWILTYLANEYEERFGGTESDQRKWKLLYESDNIQLDVLKTLPPDMHAYDVLNALRPENDTSMAIVFWLDTSADTGDDDDDGSPSSQQDDIKGGSNGDKEDSYEPPEDAALDNIRINMLHNNLWLSHESTMPATMPIKYLKKEVVKSLVGRWDHLKQHISLSKLDDINIFTKKGPQDVYFLLENIGDNQTYRDVLGSNGEVFVSMKYVIANNMVKMVAEPEASSSLRPTRAVEVQDKEPIMKARLEVGRAFYQMNRNSIPKDTKLIGDMTNWTFELKVQAPKDDGKTEDFMIKVDNRMIPGQLPVGQLCSLVGSEPLRFLLSDYLIR